MSTKGDDNKCHPMRYLFLRYTAAGQFNLYPFIKLISQMMLLACLFTLWSSCEPLVTEFEDIENGQMYKSSSTGATPAQVSKIKILTWNIRFGDGRIPWFGDSCGDRVLLSEREVLTNLESVAGVINEIKPDILMINEITVDAKLTAYIDQVQWLLDHTYFNYASYASNWKTQFIPSDGLGRMDMGNAIFSRWEISDSKRISLSQRGDQDALTTYFYLRWNILKTKIEVPDLDNFYVLSTHLAAFSTDDTKKKQVTEVMDE
jgi:endonuclease/exonuclease/phosphatase family metal-dependent hydrolase